jgi:two-component system, chemotaxis family, protein-glutamate methylesterase/glutaminase
MNDNKSIRVLVVDDSAVFRRLVSSTLEDDPGIDVVGTASNGKIALQRIEQLNPDVVTLDVEMPEMDGIETLAALQKLKSKVQVIMVSALTERGAAVTIDALSLGALDFITKPSGTGSIDASKALLRDSLVPKVKAFAPQEKIDAPKRQAPIIFKAPTVPQIPIRRDVVLIGVSTGGPNALAELVPKLPANLGAGVLIVQHMPPIFTAQLAARLNSISPLSVKEAQGGEIVRPGEVLIAPGGKHMVVEAHGGDKVTRITEDPPENNCRPAVDPLFRSAAPLYGNKVLGVILTGMGKDGFVGVRILKEKNVFVIAQDEASCVVYGMPKFIVEDGLADKVLPLGEIADEIAYQVAGSFVRRT